jgi:hypothetical protein
MLEDNNKDERIGKTIIAYGQEAKIVGIENVLIHLDHAIVVPTIIYTRDYIFEDEIQKYVT